MRDGYASVDLAGAISQGSPIDRSVLFFSATLPSDAVEEHEFVLRVVGDDLVELGIQHSDLLVIERRPDGDAATGELALAELNENAFVGRWWCKHGRRALLDASWNTITEDKQLRIVGVVTGVVRYALIGD